MNKKSNVAKKILSLLLMVFLLVPIFNNGLVKADEDVEYRYYIKVNKATNVVTVYTMNDQPYTAFTASCGSATPTGTFYTPVKYRWRELMGPCYGQYCTRITGGILFHSVWYYYNNDYDSQAYAQYNKLGTTCSHGCVRLTVAACKWIYDNCPLGTKVIIFNGTEEDDPLGKPKTIAVDSGRTMGWDPTDPDENNPYDTGHTVPKIKVKSTSVQVGEGLNKSNVKVIDSMGEDITSWARVKGEVDMYTPGKYKVTYKVCDSFGRTAKKKVTYTVADKKAVILTLKKTDIKRKIKSDINLFKNAKSISFYSKKQEDYLKIYVKAPGEEEYTLLNVKKEDKYRFNKAGEYSFMYVAVNEGNFKQTVDYLTVKVTDPNAPLVIEKPEIEVTTPDAIEEDIASGEREAASEEFETTEETSIGTGVNNIRLKLMSKINK